MSIIEWMEAQNQGGWQDTIYGQRWVGPLPSDPVARQAEQQATTAANNAYWGLTPAPAPVPSPVSAAPPPTTSPSSGLSPDQQSARAIIQSALDQYGLGQLGESLWKQYLDGAPTEQIFLNLRQTTEYKTRFAGMAALQQKGRAISEAEYIATERGIANAMRAAGIPSGLFDSPDDFARFIGGEVSAMEVASRLEQYNRVLHENPPEVLDQLQRLYGISEGQLLAFSIDPDRTQVQINKSFEASMRSAAAARTGFGGLSQGEAERLVELGVTDREAGQGFGELVNREELFTSLDAGEDAIGREDQIGAVFGNDAAAQERIRRREAKRLAEFNAGGSFASGQSGISGLGSAAR